LFPSANYLLVVVVVVVVVILPGMTE